MNPLLWLGIYFAGAFFFAIKCREAPKELADGASGKALPRWWSEVLFVVSVLAWPLALAYGLFVALRPSN